MSFEYEALVGHLYVVGGRAIPSTPPGSLVEAAPKRVARGRETDTFFALVLPSGDTIAPAAFYEQMAQLSAEQYFDSSGSVTAGLRAVFQHLNENLYQHNLSDSRRYEASVVCAVLRGADLYLGKVGSGVALFYHLSEMEPFPTDFSNDEALFGPPLGVRAEPDVRMARYEVTQGTRLLMADAALADLNMDQIHGAISAEDIGAVLAGLKETVASQITLLAIEFVPPEAPLPLPAREAESTVAAPLAAPEPVHEPTPAAAPVETARPAPPGGPRRVDTLRPIKRLFGGIALVLSKILGLLNSLLDRLIPRPKEGQKNWLGTPAAAGIAVFIPVVVVVLVVIMWLTGTGESEYDLCFKEATSAAELARGIASSDVTGTMAAWSAVNVVVDRCSAIRSDDPALQTLTREAQMITDRLLTIERREVTPIEAFPNADLTRILMQGEDLYVLDNRNEQVYRVTLTTEGGTTVPGTRQPIPAMRRSGVVNQFTVGDIVDIAWAEDARGVSQGNVITALDRSGILIDCPPRFLQNCSAQQLLGSDTWVEPVAMTFWQGRLYILDPAANQIWRYEASGSSFPSRPTEYFVGQGRPDIRTAVDFAIDSAGSVYVLLQDGSLGRFTGGQRVNFGFASFPEGQSMNDVDAFFLNSNPIAQGMAFVSRATRTVYETTLAGTFINSFRAYDESLFVQLSDVVVDSNRQIIYTVSGNSILSFSRSR